MPGCVDVWIFVLSRSARLIAQGVALTGVVAGTVAFASFDKAVALSVDGRSTQVHAFGSTVDDVLRSEGVRVGRHDLVSPAPSSRVHDGSEVVVRYGRKLTVTTDGVASDHWTTALTVDEALTQLGLRADSAKLSVSRSLPLGRQGLAVKAGTRKNVTLVVGGKPLQRTTFTTSVDELLAETQVTMNPLDRLSATPTTRLRDGATVRLTRVQRTAVAGKAAVPFTVRKVSTADLDKGTTKVRTRGRTGVARVTYVETWVDGRRTARAVASRTVTAPPVTQVELVGTRKVEVASTSSSSASIPSSGGLNWAALARCESGGNPRAVNPNGHYGLYQFSLQTWAGVGGSGNPTNASVAEQTRRAQMLYSRSGAGQWSCGSHLFD